MSLIQILIVLFVGFAGSRVILRFRDKAISYGEFFFWSSVWALVLCIVFKPSLADTMAVFFGVRRGADIVFFSAIILLFYLIFRLYVKIESLDRQLTGLNTGISKALHCKEKTR